MKKIIALLFALALCAAPLAGCQTAPTVYNFDSVLPWTDGHSARYEKCDYAVTREYVEPDGQNYKIRETVANGAFSLTVNGDKIDAEFSVTYNDSPYAAGDGKNDGGYKGKTDVITSSATVAATLLPITSVKTARLETAPEKSYAIKADYEAKTSEFIMPIEGGQTKTLNISRHIGVYDNETLYYVARAYADLKEGASINFNAVNLFDSHASGRFFNYEINIAAAADLVTVDGLPSAFKAFGLAEIADGAHTKIDCYKVILSLTKAERGPAVTLYYAAAGNDFDRNDDKRKKVLIKMETAEYEPYSGKETYKTAYVLNGYSMRPPVD